MATKKMYDGTPKVTGTIKRTTRTVSAPADTTRPKTGEISFGPKTKRKPVAVIKRTVVNVKTPKDTTRPKTGEIKFR